MVDERTVSTIIRKNLEVALLAFKAGDLQLTNILGNRAMSDAVILETKEFALLGFFTKQMALAFINLKPRISESDFLNAKLLGEKYLTDLISGFDTMNIIEQWTKYHEMHLQIMKFPGSDLDKPIQEIYGTDMQFTSFVCDWLINFMIAKKVVLFDRSSNLFKGVVNELQRVGLIYGYEVKNTVVFSCLISLDRYYDYFKLQHTTANGVLDHEAVTKDIFPYIEAIKGISSSDILPYEQVTNLLWELIKGWREYFICYLEQPQNIVEKTVELSKESKAKLSDMLGKALQKEVRP